MGIFRAGVPREAVLELDFLVLSTRTTAFSNTHLVRMRGLVVVALLSEGNLTGLTSSSSSSRSQRMTLQTRLVGLYTTWWHGKSETRASVTCHVW